MEHRAVVDMHEPAKGVGWIVDPNNPKDEHPLTVRKEGKLWMAYAGTSDEYRGYGSSVLVAIRRCTRMAGHQGGTFTICYEYKSDQDHIHNV